MKALPLLSPGTGFTEASVRSFSSYGGLSRGTVTRSTVKAKMEKGKKDEVEHKKRKQSLFGGVTEALDFSQVRSAEDAELLEEAREATMSGSRMTREQVKFFVQLIGFLV